MTEVESWREIQSSNIEFRSGCGSPSTPVADRGWKRRFDEPIPLPRGPQLVTLEDAGNYITRLPKAERDQRDFTAEKYLPPF